MMFLCCFCRAATATPLPYGLELGGIVGIALVGGAIAGVIITAIIYSLCCRRKAQVMQSVQIK